MREGNAPGHVVMLIENEYWSGEISKFPAIVKDVWWYWHRDDFWDVRLND